MNIKSYRPRIRKPLLFVSLLMPVVLLLSACASATASPAPAVAVKPTATTAATLPSDTPTAAAAAATEATINVATDAKLGQILVDGKGMTLYMFTKDEPNKSNCSGGCLTSWPPLLTQGNPTLGPGVDKALIGSADMPDGTKIVTYNKMPLYYWFKDTKPGDTTGQGNKDVWYVVSPAGEAVGYTPLAAVTPTSDTSAAAATPTSNTSMAASSEATIDVVNDPKLGQILVDDKGMTLYMYTKDEPDKSNCSGGCLEAWPPLLTQGNPTLGPGVDAKLVGSTTLADGTKIVTYNHMPLYYWYKDVKPGDTTGQGNKSVWYVVNPAGDAVGR